MIPSNTHIHYPGLLSHYHASSIPVTVRLLLSSFRYLAQLYGGHSRYTNIRISSHNGLTTHLRLYVSHFRFQLLALSSHVPSCRLHPLRLLL